MQSAQIAGILFTLNANPGVSEAICKKSYGTGEYKGTYEYGLRVVTVAEIPAVPPCNNDLSIVNVPGA